MPAFEDLATNDPAAPKVMKPSLRFRGARSRAGITGGRADKEFLPVRERDDAAVCAVGPIFRLETFDENFGADRQRILLPAAAEQCVWCSGFDPPARDFAVVA